MMFSQKTVKKIRMKKKRFKTKNKRIKLPQIFRNKKVKKKWNFNLINKKSKKKIKICLKKINIRNPARINKFTTSIIEISNKM